MKNIKLKKGTGFTLLTFMFLSSLLVGYAEANASYNNDSIKISSTQPTFAPDEIIVKYKPGADVYNIANKQRGKVNEKLTKLRMGEIKIPLGARVQEEIFKYKLDPLVESVQPNYIYRVASIPNDPNYSSQWGIAKIKADQAWDTTSGSSSVTIAVVDTGVDADHPDLTANLVAGYNTINNTTNSDDDYGHGTHVAGIAAGVTNNGAGISGVAGSCKIMPVKVMGATGSGYSSDVNEGIIWAADHGAKVINLSLGFTGSDPAMQTAIDYAYNKGVVVVAAAGNSNTSTPSYPAACNHVVAVAATDQYNNRATFSNYGAHIDVAAPGVAILSTTFDGAYGYKQGTSMASPYVAGVAGLVLSQRPTLTPGQVERVLQTSAVDIGTIGKDSYFGYGLVDALKALTQQVDTSPIELAVTSVTPNIIRSGVSSKITYTIGKQGYVTIKIKDSNNNLINTLLNRVLKNAGTQYITWLGKTTTGLTVASGDYTYEIQAEDLAGNLSTPLTGNITVDNTLPVINNPLVSTSPYVPNGSNSTDITYDLSENSKVTAKIYNSSNILITTLANATSQNAGTSTLSWNGKNSAGALVGDDTYTVKIDAVDNVGLKAIQKTVAIVIEAKNPDITAVTDSPDPFRPLGTNVNTIKYTLSEKAYVNINIYDSSNNIVKTLLPNSLITAGAKTITWNGKNTSGIIVPSGNYKYEIIGVDLAGNSSPTITGNITVDVTTPIISNLQVSISPFVPNGSNSIDITYDLSEYSKVTAKLYNSSNVLIATLANAVSQNAGGNTLSWYGKNSAGALVGDDTYTVKIDAVDIVGLKSVQQSGTIYIDLTAPTISGLNVSVNPFKPSGNYTTISYNLTETSKVTVAIYNSNNLLVRTLMANISKAAGVNSVNWYGTNASNYIVPTGVYTYKIDAIDLVGNKATQKTGTITVQ